MCEIERHRFSCCRKVYEKFKKNASFCQSMEPGLRCDKVYNMYVGKIQDHKEGMCPTCLKAQRGPFGTPMGRPAPMSQYPYPPQAQHRFKQEQQGQVQAKAHSQYTKRYGGPSSGSTSGHPASEPPRRGYDNFRGVDIRQCPPHEAPQILPHNLAGHTPIPIPPVKSQYTPPHFSGSEPSLLALRPVFEPPTRRFTSSTANGKQGMGTRKASPKPKRLPKPDADEDYEPRKTRAQALAQTQTQSSSSYPAPRPCSHPSPERQPAPMKDFFFGVDLYNNPYGFQADFSDQLNDLNQPSKLSQPQEIQHIKQRETRSQYPEDVNYAGYNGENGAYNPPIFGKSYPFQKTILGTFDNGSGFTDEEIWDEVDWERVNQELMNVKFFADTAQDTTMMEGVEENGPASSSVDIPRSSNLQIQMERQGSDSQMPEYQAYSFPGSMFPMPVVNMQGQRTEVVDEKHEKIEDEDLDDPLSLLFPD